MPTHLKPISIIQTSECIRVFVNSCGNTLKFSLHIKSMNRKKYIFPEKSIFASIKIYEIIGLIESCQVHLQHLETKWCCTLCRLLCIYLFATLNGATKSLIALNILVRIEQFVFSDSKILSDDFNLASIFFWTTALFIIYSEFCSSV